MNHLQESQFWAGPQDLFLMVLFIIIAVFALEALLYLVLKRVFKVKNALPFMLVAPAAIGLIVLVLYPILYNFGIAFSNLNLPRLGMYIREPMNDLAAQMDSSTVGGIAGTFSQMLTEMSAVDPNQIPAFGIDRFFANLGLVFSEPVLKQTYFGPILLKTLLWTFVQVFFHVGIGLVLAMWLNRPMKMRGLYRTLILFPWAVPQIIAVLAWRSEFNFDFGLFNTVLRTIFGPEAGVQWMTDPTANFVAMNLVNIWLGVPFMSVVLLGGLQSIDSTYYEAANMDGANKFQQFRKVTLPLIQPVLAPSIILGVIWTFQNFNVPFFINQYELESSDILITALYRAAFEYNRYGFAAAFAVVVFAILLVFTLIYFKMSKASLNLDESKSTHRAVGE